MASVVCAIASPSLRNALVALLRQVGHSVVASSSIEEFMSAYGDALHGRPFHVAIVDFQLPEKTGCPTGKKDGGLTLIRKITARVNCASRSGDRPNRRGFLRTPQWVERLSAPVPPRFVLIGAIAPPGSDIEAATGRGTDDFIFVKKSVHLSRNILPAVDAALYDFWTRRRKRAKTAWWMLVPLVVALVVDDIVRGISFSSFTVSFIGLLCLVLVHLTEVRRCNPERNGVRTVVAQRGAQECG